MADTILKPTTIEEVSFPELQQTSTTVNTGGGGASDTLSPTQDPQRTFPTQIIARTVIADSLDTQSRRILSDYTFGEYGSLAVGKYESGVSGDVKISPSGIVARNKNGETSFSLDATTGDATFKGTVAAGAIIANNRVFITEAGILVNDGTNDRIIIGEW